MNPRNKTLDEARLFKMANDVDSLARDTKSQLDVKFTQIEGVLKDVNNVKDEVKNISSKVELNLKALNNKFEEHTNEIVDVIKEIKSEGLKGDKGDDADEEAIEKRLLDKIPKMEDIISNFPKKEELVAEVISQIPENKPSLKIIQESIDIKAVADKVKEELTIENLKDWKDKLKEIKLEISRNKSYQQVSGGGFNNIANASGVVSAGLSTLKFTGSGVSSVTQSGSTVTVDIAGGGGSGTVTDVSVASANGFAGSVATSTSTPVITLSTTVTGLVKANGTALSAAVANTDYQSPIILTTTGTSGAATFNGTTLNIPNYTSGGGTPGGSDTQLQYNNAGAFGGISGATTNGTAVTFTTTNLIGADVKAGSSAGLQILSNSNTVTALFGGGGGANSTFYGGSKFDYATASTIGIFDASKNLISADTATYPSLTELSYVKGVTSAIQTQLDAKGSGTVTSVSVTTANGVSGSVANATTTPAITLTLGNITPTTIAIGTLNYSPSNALITSQQSVNSYSQNIIQNTSTGATASADYVVNNSASTDTTFYGNFGMNSTGFTGTNVFNQPSYVYLTSTSTDLAIGTTTAHGMHFVVNNGTTDAMTIASSGAVTIPGVTTMSGLNVITHSSTGLIVRNPANTFSYTITGAAIAAARTLNLPLITGTDTLASLGLAQTWTGAQTFNNASVLAGAATMAIFNTTATNISFAGAATTLAIGAATGTATIANATVTLSNATTLNINGASPSIVTTSTATASVFNTNALTGNLFGAATTLTVGGTPTGAVTHNYSTNATAAATTKTVNLGTGGAASSTTNINIGSSNGGTTTVNSLTISLGGTTGVTTTGTIELGAASDTTLARVAAGIISVEGEVMNGYATTATAAGTTTLTITSAKTQYFTGTSTQTVKLPTTSVILGQSYTISNQSTGTVTVQSSGANTIQILGAGMTATFVANTATPTTAAHWNYSMIEYVGLNNAITASSNAATINLAYKTNTVTNNSAATLTITLPTAGAIDGQMRVVRVLDFSAVAQTITWVNTEDSTATAPTTSNGSTTLPKTAGFQYNAATSKWRCTASA